MMISVVTSSIPDFQGWVLHLHHTHLQSGTTYSFTVSQYICTVQVQSQTQHKFCLGSPFTGDLA